MRARLVNMYPAHVYFQPDACAENMWATSDLCRGLQCWQVSSAVLFLNDASVRDQDVNKKVAYMKQKLAMTDQEIKASLAKAAFQDREGVKKKAVAFLTSSEVKASADEVAKAKYLMGKLAIARDELADVYKKAGLQMPELPAEEPEETANQPPT
eukprot:SAG25_NODE_165_length_13094_cov_31.386149_3_plen_155_part_00